MQLIANISLLFCEIPLLDRFEAARHAGFDGVEIQFPYFENLEEIRRASLKSNMPVVLINIPAGDRKNGDIGLAALPGRRKEFLENVEQCAVWAETLKVKKVNVLAGNPKASERNRAFDTLVENLLVTGDRFAGIGVKVLLEAINPFDAPDFFISSLQSALDAIEATDHPNVQFQLDFYHMARTEPSLAGAIHKAGSRIGHVQFADSPGRHEPGSGEIDFPAAFQALKRVGYQGEIAAEYNPQESTNANLQWMRGFQKL